MYYRKRQTQKIDPSIGGILNVQNAEETLASEDITQAGGIVTDDFELMQEMYPKTAKKLLQFVKKAVESNMYDGSPILRDIGPDRTCIDQLTSEALDMAANAYDGAEEVTLDAGEDEWCSGRLLHDLTETMILAEVFLAKRNKNNALNRPEN